jgi:hypothetical protein
VGPVLSTGAVFRYRNRTFDSTFARAEISLPAIGAGGSSSISGTSQ